MTECSFIYKNGRKCLNNSIKGLSFCHIKGHNFDITKYEKVVNEIYQDFESDRVCLNKFKHEKILSDGACLYRSIIVSLITENHYNLSDFVLKIKNLEYFNYLEEKERDLFLEEYDDIIDNFTGISERIPEEIETELAIYIQKLSRIYIIKNRNNLILENIPEYKEIFPDMTIEQFVEDTHDILFNEYEQLYDKFAGFDDYEYEIEKIKLKSGKEVIKKKRVFIQDRWGGIPEILALCNLFEIGVNIYLPQKLDDRTFNIKTMQSWKNNSKIYLKLMQSINHDSNKYINLLLIEKRDGSHYESLI